MALSLIDEQPINNASIERAVLIKEMTRHQVATTGLPHWWKNYWPLFLAEPGCALGVWISLFPIEHPIPWGARLVFSAFFAGIGAFAAVSVKSNRRGERFLVGQHASVWCRIEYETTKLRNQISSFNDAVRTLERLTNIPEELRAIAERKLPERRAQLLAWHERLVEEFQSAFGPCIAELEARGVYSRAKQLEADKSFECHQLDQLANTVGDFEFRRGISKLIDETQKAVPALSVLPDPLTSTEDVFAKLERLHGHEIPR